MDHLADAMRTERGCSEGRVLEGTASGSTEALLWVHGVTNALNPKLHYYQGKRRIPAPVILRRHAGNSIFECSRPRYWVSQRWTGTRSICIQSCRPPWSRLTGSRGSGVVSQFEKLRHYRIGSLLDRFGTNPYDYRLFI